MTRKEKQLLLRDLCSRLPYGVKVKFKVNEVIANKENIIYNVDGEDSYITDGKSYFTWDFIKALTNNYLDEIKPYLYPLSSMEELGLLEEYNHIVMGWNNEDVISVNYIDQLLDFYHRNHLDYNGLISKGLAINCINLNIY